MTGNFYVSREQKIWTIRRFGLLYAEHEKRGDALRQVVELARRYDAQYIVHAPSLHLVAPQCGRDGAA